MSSSIRDELLRAYRAYALRTVAEAPEALVDGDARRLVCEIGVPRGLMEAITLTPSRMQPVAEKFGFLDSHRALDDQLLFIGYIQDDVLCLDGTTGAVSAIAAREGALPAVVNGHLSLLVRCMAVVETHLRTLWTGGPVEERVAQMISRLEAVDPLVADPGSAWHAAIRTICRNG
ncbi:SUKH-4 family immunity protein [Streptodolium elevatio]